MGRLVDKSTKVAFEGDYDREVSLGFGGAWLSAAFAWKIAIIRKNQRIIDKELLTPKVGSVVL